LSVAKAWAIGVKRAGPMRWRPVVRRYFSTWTVLAWPSQSAMFQGLAPAAAR
jgi:hypothetical protein